MDTVIRMKCMIEKNKKEPIESLELTWPGTLHAMEQLTLLLFGARLLIAYGLAAFRSYSVVLPTCSPNVLGETF